MALKLEQFSLQATEGDTLLVGWHRVNITPDYGVKLAGYGIRGPVNEVHDSLFANVVIFDNGSMSVALVSLDLLLFPRLLSESLVMQVEKGNLPVDAIFFGAIHTHNGYGHWEKSPAIQLAFGGYRSSLIANLQEQIEYGIHKAYRDRKSAKIGYIQIPVPEYVINRLDRPSGKTDHSLRSMVIEQVDGRRAIVTTYSAHPVVLDTDILELSRDYPGYLTDHLEEEGAFDLAVFLAGMVGSHTVAHMPLSNYPKADSIGKGLSGYITGNMDSVRYYETQTMACVSLDVELPDPVLRISENLGVRSWIFERLMGQLKGNIRVFRIGNIVMMGMPCDFSGEISVNASLDSLAKSGGYDLMITSFNGNYTGYITDDCHFDKSRNEEVMLMNWTGPYMGAYFTWIIKNILRKGQN